MLTAYPRSLRWRQSLPPLFVFSTLVLGTASIFWNVALLLLGLVFFLQRRRLNGV